MSPAPHLLPAVILTALLLAIVVQDADSAPASDREVGESLVLAGTTPGQLRHGRLRPGSVAVRSTYLPTATGSIAYVERQDYAVDYAAGQVRRLEGSRIPDYTGNQLWGKKDFDHRNFPGFGNYRDFVFVDYRHRDSARWPVQAAQAALLPRSSGRLKSGEPITLAAFGDSITAGGDATSPELIYWQQWVRGLRGRYPKATIHAVNAATGGDTTIQGLARLEQKVLALKPDLVLVAFGMNDQNVGSVPLDKFEANLTEIVDRIRKDTPAEIILLSSCLPNPNWHWTSGRMPEYGAATRRVAASRQCAFADVQALWRAVVDRKKPEDLLANNVNHPNDYGHWLYAQVLEQLGL